MKMAMEKAKKAKKNAKKLRGAKKLPKTRTLFAGRVW
jgi:hypothetical protein